MSTPIPHPDTAVRDLQIEGLEKRAEKLAANSTMAALMEMWNQLDYKSVIAMRVVTKMAIRKKAAAEGLHGNIITGGNA